MSIARSSIRSDLNNYVDDSANTIWSADQKNLAINLAVRVAWPDLRVTKSCATYLLAAASYIYTVTTATRTPWGYSQVYVEPAAAATGPYILLRSADQKNDSGTWKLYLGKDDVDDNTGRALRIWWHEQYAELGADGDTTELPRAYMLYQSLFELCKMESLKGHHTDAQVFVQNAPDFLEVANREREKHMTLPLVPYVGRPGTHGSDVYYRRTPRE